jgi:hypothetical protein
MRSLLVSLVPKAVLPFAERNQFLTLRQLPSKQQARRNATRAWRKGGPWAQRSGGRGCVPVLPLRSAGCAHRRGASCARNRLP